MSAQFLVLALASFLFPLSQRCLQLIWILRRILNRLDLQYEMSMSVYGLLVVICYLIILSLS